MNAVSMLALARRIAFASLISALLHTSLHGQYLITQLNAAGYQADCVIITSPNYLSAIQPLAAMRFTLSKLSVGIAFTDSIYKLVGPAAVPDSTIRNFISFTVANWGEPKPKYFVLAGNVNTVPSHKEAGLFLPDGRKPGEWREEDMAC